ncbi:MAG: diaminohydroxyphosphoribosylaminopyrimidine deaminase, partial [Candidatus Krumholzibacteriia bacterium]
VVAAGIKRVVIAMLDPNPTVAGGGVAHLEAAGIEVACGVAAPEALELVWPFVSTENFGRPFVELKTAHSLDGFFAPPLKYRTKQAPVYLTGADARRDVHRRRRRVDMVLVGEGTVAADQPRLDGRLANDCDDIPQIDPTAAYVDTDLSWRGGFQRSRYIVFAGENARESGAVAEIESDGGEIIFCREDSGKVDPCDVVAKAYEQGFHSIMVEGGPTLAAAFLRAELVDRWVKYQAPILLGDGITWPRDFMGANNVQRNFYLTESMRMGADLVSVYDRQCFADLLKQVAGGGI